MKTRKILIRAIPAFVLLGGTAIAASLFLTAPTPQAAIETSLPRQVSTIRAAPTTHILAVKAYGTSRAAEEWKAISEVSGPITTLHDRFQEGELIQSGEVIARIEKTDYELAAKTAETEVVSQEQRLLELSQTQQSLQRMMSVRQEQLLVAKQELERVEQLQRRGAGSTAEFDRASSAYLERLAIVEDMQSQLALIPVRKDQANTAKQAAQLRLQQAKRDVQRCEIRAPFTALCMTRDIELHQQAAIGQPIGNFLKLERAEIVCMVEARRAGALLPSIEESHGPLDLRMMTKSLVEEIRERFDVLRIAADVTWRAGDGRVQWRGRVARIAATVDEATRAIPFIIEVDDAFSAVQVGVKPALVPGMFVETMIYGDQRSDVFVVPREAIRDDSVYLVRNGRLTIAPVRVISLEDRRAVIDRGLSEGDQIVIADLFPAAAGMELRYHEVENPVEPRTELPQLVAWTATSKEARQ